MSLVFRSLAVLVLSCASATAAQSPPPSQPTVITHVRLVDDPDAPQVAILLRDGRIHQILSAGEELPVGWLEVDGEGALAVPAFVDAYTVAGLKTPEPQATKDAMSSLVGNVHIGMREANRKGLQPAFSGASVFDLGDEGREAYRDQGFAALHSCPSGQVLGGQSLVATLGETALRDRLIQVDLYQAAALRASGSGFPSTLMGYLSHLRQFVNDAQWHSLRKQRVAAGKADRRPPFDADLDAVQPLLAGEQTLLCQANDYGDILRWISFGKKQGVKIMIGGGRDAWMVTDELLEANVSVLLGLDWGKEVKDPDEKKEEKGEGESTPELEDGESATPEVAVDATPDEDAADADITTLEEEVAVAGDSEAGSEASEDEDQEPDWIYEEPLDVRRERRRLWVERRDCAIRLHEAGVTFAIGTEQQSSKDLLKNLRKLVEAGLPETVAMASLTTNAADLLNSAGTLGQLQPGFAANVALWGGSPFAKKAKLHWLFVDGATYEYEIDEEASGDGPSEGVELTGDWTLDYDDNSAPSAGLSLTMEEDGALSGVLSFEAPGGDESSSDLSGIVNGKAISLKGTIEMGNFSAEISVDAVFEDDGFSGDAVWKYSGGESSNSFTARLKPKRVLEDFEEESHSGHNHGPYDRTNEEGGYDR